MKSITVASIVALGLASNAAATISVLLPWNGVTWSSGGVAEVTWSADTNDANAQCHIQLMNGDTTDGQIVAYITNPEAPVPCSDRRYDISPLNDFSPGDYWVRVGSGETWSYSSKFKFEGKGSVDTSRMMNAPVNILLGETSGSLKPSGSATGSGAGGASSTVGASSTAGGSVITPSATDPTSGASMTVPSGGPSNATASKSSELTLSGSASAPSKSSSPTSSSGQSSTKKKNAKIENSAAASQSSQGWMVAGVAAIFLLPW